MEARFIFYLDGLEVDNFKELTDNLSHILVGMIGEETFWAEQVKKRGVQVFLKI